MRVATYGGVSGTYYKHERQSGPGPRGAGLGARLLGDSMDGVCSLFDRGDKQLSVDHVLNKSDVLTS